MIWNYRQACIGQTPCSFEQHVSCIFINIYSSAETIYSYWQLMKVSVEDTTITPWLKIEPRHQTIHITAPVKTRHVLTGKIVSNRPRNDTLCVAQNSTRSLYKNLEILTILSGVSRLSDLHSNIIGCKTHSCLANQRAMWLKWAVVCGVRGVASGIWEGAIPPGEILFTLSTKNAEFYAFLLR